MRSFAWTVALLLAVVAAPAVARPRAAPATFAPAVDQYERDADKEGVVGGSVALIDRRGLIAERDHGFRDVTANLHVDPDTIWHWASVTKVFTAIAAMQLVERGELSLDDPVVKYVPEFGRVHDPFGPVSRITIRHLLTHSAGLRGATWPWNADGEAAASDWQRHEPQNWSQIAAMMPYTGIEFEPGTKASYSNLGLSVLGRVVEVITNDTIGVRIDKEILKPLGMTRSYFNATPWLLRPERSHNYVVQGGQRTDLGAEVDTGATIANGGLNGPMSDMARFVAFLLGAPDIYPVLKRETLESMLKPQLLFEKDERRSVWIGLGFFVVEEREAGGGVHRYFGHSGFQQGHRTSLYLSQDGTGAFVFAANTATRGGNPSPSTLRVRLVDQVFPAMRAAGGAFR